MGLSITQRLTIMVAALSFLTLAPAATTLYLLMRRDVEAKGIEQANVTLRNTSKAILAQLDEDLFLEVSPGRTRFDELRTSFDHWRVVRADGMRLAARGILGGSGPALLGARTQTLRFPNDGVFAVASAPLVNQDPIQWEDIPAPARDAVVANAPGGTFLSARRIVFADRTIYDVKLLFADRVASVEVDGGGELLETERKDLPDRLPTWLEIATPSGRTIRQPCVVDWQAHEGELIALVDGQTEGGEPVRLAVNRFGEQYVLDADGRVVQMLDESRLWLVVAYDMRPDLAGLRTFGQAATLGGTLVWLLIVTIAWQVTKRALRPVDEIVRRAGSIDAPHLSERLPVGTADDELSRVAGTVNQMLDRIQEGYRREQQFTGDASHEMRNPLAKMLAEIDWASSKPRRQKEYMDTLERLRRYAGGMQQLTEALLILARLDGRPRSLEVEPFDTGELAMEIVKGLPKESAGRIRLEFGESTDPMQAVGHRRLIGILLSNLIDNALKYSPPQSPVSLRISRNSTRIHLAVADEGPGIPESEARLVFNRFHRLEKSRSRRTGGAGLGLSIVQAIADVHNTRVTLHAGAVKGTTAAFTLPVFTAGSDSA